MSKINKIVKLLEFEDAEIFGSFGIPTIKVNASDVDMQEFINTNKINKSKDIYKWIHQQFINKVKEIKQRYGWYLIDFKCGYWGLSSVPLRWDYEQILKGFQIIDGVKYKFTNALHQKSLIKIDCIVLVKPFNRYMEVSNNYYFYYSDYNTKPDSVIIEERNVMMERVYLREYMDHKSDGDYYKALKRLYRMYFIRGDKNKMKRFEDLFNSKIGKFHKQINNLETIKSLYEQTFKPVNYKDILYNLSVIIEHTDIIKYKNMIKKLYNYIHLKRNMIMNINEIIKRMNKHESNVLKDYIKNNVKYNDLLIDENI